MEHEIEERLRQKYTLIDRTDPMAVAAAQQAGLISEDTSMVGESDGSGFGVGNAPRSAKAEPSAVVQLKKKEKERESKKKGFKDRQSRQNTQTSLLVPVAGKASTSPSHSAKGDRELKSPHTPVDRKEDKELDGTASPISSMGTGSNIKERPSTPPSRTTAFEEFKQERGSKINSILIENKEILAVKKKLYTERARTINGNKIEIDNLRQRLDHLKADREAQGTMFNEEGDVIISEEEFNTIKQLKEMKQSYRVNFDELKNLKSEVQYCQKLVDQCRQKLIQEFDNWYAESFLNVNEENSTSLAAGHGMRPGVLMAYNTQPIPEDEQEKFDRLQRELLMNDPDSMSFYNAQMRTQRRKTYGSAMAQPQPSFNQQRSVGTPTMNIRNRPPTLLQVQY
ncbi:kinesin-like protein KIF9 [Patella vulgata]|uniref:kinesin-like protein KIF9 n=1 Tax=Patella vulgata TaxID=6465 RepID=UPI0024A821FD|nr:kinesin-like protein KIF9 [Patella vulgata]